MGGGAVARSPSPSLNLRAGADVSFVWPMHTNGVAGLLSWWYRRRTQRPWRSARGRGQRPGRGTPARGARVCALARLVVLRGVGDPDNAVVIVVDRDLVDDRRAGLEPAKEPVARRVIDGRVFGERGLARVG